VKDGAVFVGSSDRFLYALDAATGAKRWAYETGDKILGGANWFSAPAKEGQPAATRVIVGSYDYALHCVDAGTGALVWKVETDNYINGTPAITASGEAIFGGCDAQLHVVSVVSGKELRAMDAEAYIPGSTATWGPLVYFGNHSNQVFAFDSATGKRVWAHRDRNFPYFSSPAVTEELVVIGGGDKRLHCLNRADGTAKWVFQTKGKVESSPVIGGDAAVVGSEDGRLYCVALADGAERWNYDVGAPITGSPAVAAGVIVVGAEDGNVYCFGAK
jgi:outer membrane protein assembly factor BamB